MSFGEISLVSVFDWRRLNVDVFVTLFFCLFVFFNYLVTMFTWGPKQQKLAICLIYAG